VGEARAIAVEELLAESDWVRRLARALVSDPDAAEDVAQQALVAALERPPKADRPLRPWLRVVVENFARMRRRSEGARARREEQVARKEADTSTEAAYERVELQRSLASDVLALEEPFREAVVLHYYAGLTSVEIARRTGSPEGTIRWRLKRGLEQLRERLDRRHGGDRTVWLSALAGWCREPDMPLASGSFGALLALAGMLALGIGVLLFAVRGGERHDAGAVALPPTLVAESAPELDVVPTRAAPEAEAPPVAELGGRRLRARIVDARGWPIPNVLARVHECEARADEQGELDLTLAPQVPRTSHLALELEADGFVRESLDFVAPRDGTLEFGTLQLARAGALEGRVVDLDHRPLEGAWVRVEVLGSRWTGLEPHPVEEARYMGSMLPDDVPLATADERGQFRIDGLRAGYVRLWYGAEGHEVEWADELAVREGQATDAGTLVLRTLDARGCIEGRVLDPQGQPLAGALVECARQSLRRPLFRGHSKARRTTADELGRFRLWVEPSSRYDVGAADPLGRHRPVALGTFAAGDHEVELRLAEWRPLEVLVLDGEAREIADARVELVDSERGDTLVRESDEWNAGRHVAPWCDFEIVVHAPGCLVERLGPFRADVAPAQVLARPASAPRVHGHVHIEGRGAEDARVELLLAAEPSRGSVSAREPGFEPFQARVAVEPGRRSVRTAPDGSFELAAPVGQAFFVRAASSTRAALTLGPYTLRAKEGLELTFELPLGGSLVGHVVRRDAEPVAGTLVGVSRGDGLVATFRVDTTGAFEFRGLEPGEWQVRRVAREALGFEPLQLVPGGPAAPRWDVTVVEGRVAQFDLRIDEASRTRLGGALKFDGVSVGPWGVEARLGAQRATDVLDPDGRFELELPREGDWVLAARWAPRGGDEHEYSEPVARWRGTFAIERDWPTATLEVELGAAHSGELVSLHAHWPGDAHLAVHTRSDREGRARFAKAPAGALQLEHEDGATLSLELRAGEVRRVDWSTR
jgi:RNA polymerase sigma-70 factor (ECF subfamily)